MKKQISNKNNLFRADFIRATALLFVVFLHTYAPFVSGGKDIGSANWWSAISIETITKSAVPLFIMLSGLLILDMKKQYTNSLEFYNKRISRIGIPLIFWTVFYYLAFSYFSGKIISIATFFYDVIFLNVFYHLYFLYIILGLYIITPMLKAYIDKIEENEKKLLLILLFLYAVSMGALTYIAPGKFSYWSLFTVFIPFTFYYVAGEYLPRVILSGKRFIRVWGLYLIVIFSTVIGKYLVFKAHVNTLWSARYLSDVLSINIIISSVLLFVLILNGKKLKTIESHVKLRQIVTELSHCSFGIYLIHPIVLYLFNKLDLIVKFSSLSALVLFGESVAVLFLSYLVVKISTHIKYIRLIFG